MKDASANEAGKREVGLRAAALIKSTQRVGLGTGSTAAFFIQELGRRVREEGLNISCVATSFSSAELGRASGLTILPLESFDELDISVDGADEIDPHLFLIKGGGAAHTREKIVHAMSRRFIVIADSTKRVQRLGDSFAVPVECVPSSVRFVLRRLREIGSSAEIRMAKNGKDGPVVTDNGNLVIDARMNLDDPKEREAEINCIPGVLENGIFARVHPNEALIAEDSGIDAIMLPY